MKIRPANSILIVALVAVCIGWISDRIRLSGQLSQMNESRAHRDYQIYLGSMVTGISSGKFELFDQFDFHDTDNEFAKIKNGPKYQKILSKECVTELFAIYEHQNEIEIVGSMIIGRYDARLIARDALDLLKCEEAEQFFEIAKSTEGFDSPDFHPELHDSESLEYKSFHKFISDTIAIEDQMYFEGFEHDPRIK